MLSCPDNRISMSSNGRIFFSKDNLWLKFTTVTGCSEKIVFFPRFFSILQPLLCQHLAAIGYTKNSPAISSDCTLSLLWLLRESLAAICRRGMGPWGLWKNTFFSEHSVLFLVFNISHYYKPLLNNYECYLCWKKFYFFFCVQHLQL